MALSKASCDKAFYIFRDMMGKIGSSWVQELDKENALLLGYMLGSGRKHDDGWEGVCCNIQSPTKEQYEMWEARKKEVPNTSFFEEITDGIVRFGFF